MENEKVFELMTKMYSEMQNGFNNVNERFEEVNKRFDKVETKLSKIENTVTNIEHDHGQKLEALFDGYTQNSQQLERIEKEVTKHEEIILRRIK